MFKEVFYYLLNMSIIATCIMAIVFLLRFFMKKWVSKHMIVLLWFFVLIRLLVPFAIASEASVFAIFGDAFVRNVPIISSNSEWVSDASLVFSNTIQQAVEYNPISYQSLVFEQILQVASWVWVIGLFVIIILMISVLRRFNHSLNMTYLETCDNTKVYTSKAIKTPIVIGILKPRIVLAEDFATNPEDFDNDMKSFAISHELAHIQRKDNLWKLLFTVATMIHWFNPFCWLMLNQISKDIELACDERVVKSLAKDSVKDYALALVTANERLNSYITAFSGNQLEQRIHAIIEFRRLSKIVVIITVIVYIMLSIILLTNGLE